MTPPLPIGPLRLDPPVVLAPMAGITDAPFRVTCAEHGGALFVSEMVSARGLVEGNARTWALTRFHPEERVRSLQLYATDPPVLREAVRRLLGTAPVDHLDLNFGCPVPKVTRGGGGAALPFKRRLMRAVVEAAVQAAGDVPVTVKMRTGLDEQRLTYLEAGRIAVDAGAAAVALHARSAVQGYAGRADWRHVARLKEALPDAPVLGNGDVWTAGDALDLVAQTGCDGIVVGRGCLGRPWLFADLARAFAGGAPLGPPPLGDAVLTARRHLQRSLAWYGDEALAVLRFRKQLGWYLEGYPVGPKVHKAAHQVETARDVTALLDRLDPDLHVVATAVRATRGRSGRVGRLVLPDGWCDDPDALPSVREPVAAPNGG